MITRFRLCIRYKVKIKHGRIENGWLVNRFGRKILPAPNLKSNVFATGCVLEFSETLFSGAVAVGDSKQSGAYLATYAAAKTHPKQKTTLEFIASCLKRGYRFKCVDNQVFIARKL